MSLSSSIPAWVDEAVHWQQLEQARQLSRQTRTFPLRILDRHQQDIAYVRNAMQRDYAAHRTHRDLVVKHRQGGMSTEIEAWLFVTGLTQTARIGVMAHDDKTTQMLRDMQQFFYETLPVPRPAREINSATRTYYPETRSRVYITTAGNPQSGRGGTYSHFHGSETAFWKDADRIMAGILQGVPGDGWITLESTPNGAGGWFYERVMEALDGNSDWTLHFYPWWWEAEYTLPLKDGDYLEYTAEERALADRHGLTPGQIAWRRHKQRELGRLFAQEYPEDIHTCFLTSIKGYFSTISHIETLFNAPDDAKPQEGREYIAGLDFGQAQDYTALSIMDAADFTETELLRLNRLSWQDIRQRIIDRCLYWHIDRLYAEANSIGAPNIEALRAELDERGIRIIPIQTTAKSKPLMVNNLYSALDTGGLRLLPDSIGRGEINNFSAEQTATGWRYEAAQGHDDTVIARMLAAYGLYNRPGRIVF